MYSFLHADKCYVVWEAQSRQRETRQRETCRLRGQLVPSPQEGSVLVCLTKGQKVGGWSRLAQEYLVGDEVGEPWVLGGTDSLWLCGPL